MIKDEFTAEQRKLAGALIGSHIREERQGYLHPEAVKTVERIKARLLEIRAIRKHRRRVAPYREFRLTR